MYVGARPLARDVKIDKIRGRGRPAQTIKKLIRKKWQRI